MNTSNPQVRLLVIDAEQQGQRIDNFLKTQLKGVPKSLIYRILRKGEVRVNKGRIKPEYKLQAGDIVRRVRAEATLQGWHVDVSISFLPILGKTEDEAWAKAGRIQEDTRRLRVR